MSSLKIKKKASFAIGYRMVNLWHNVKDSSRFNKWLLLKYRPWTEGLTNYSLEEWVQEEHWPWWLLSTFLMWLAEFSVLIVRFQHKFSLTFKVKRLKPWSLNSSWNKVCSFAWRNSKTWKRNKGTLLASKLSSLEGMDSLDSPLKS